MKWNNIDTRPSLENRDQFLGKWLILLGTDGKDVGVILYDFANESYTIAGKMKEISHWMYPDEVWSPSKMLKLFSILGSRVS